MISISKDLANASPSHLSWQFSNKMDTSLVFLQDFAVILMSATIGGTLFRRLGMSAVPGYIIAGLIVGTPEIVFPYVSDEQRITTIAQLGVVFLMFGIGLKFQIQRIRELGIRIVLSTTLIALLVLSAVRFSAEWLGIPAVAAIALAGVFMNSSSAIISKLVHDSGSGHQRHGQLAMGTTLLEDIVAVVMLAILGSYIAIEGSGSGRSPLLVIALLAGFALILFITGSLILPSLFRMRGIVNNPESLNILVGALVLCSGLFAVQAGFSLALGAFLCGVVIAGTPQRQFIDHGFQGLKDIFLTVFFATIGMMVDIRSFPELWIWILLGTAGAILGRAIAAWLALMLVGENPRTALQAGLFLTPLGEFSFIIAGIAIAGGLLPQAFQAVTVGTVISTSLISPVLAGHSERLTRILAPGRWLAWDRFHAAYRRLWAGYPKTPQRVSLWGFLKKRLGQIGREILIISTVLIFAKELIEAVIPFTPTGIAPEHSALILWTLVGLLTLVPMVALWRNLSACAMIMGESIVTERRLPEWPQPLIERALKVLFAILMAIWLLNVLPADLPRKWIAAIVIIVLIPAVALLWRRAVRLHSDFEISLKQHLATAPKSGSRHLFEANKEEEWNLNVRDFTLPHGSPAAGKTIQELGLRGSTGCTVVGIRRQGIDIDEIHPGTSLFPADELLMLGSTQQVDAAIRLLTSDSTVCGQAAALREKILESVTIDQASAIAGSQLQDLSWPQRFSVNVMAVARDGEVITGPSGSFQLQHGDRLLLLGPAARIAHLTESGI